MIQNKIDNLVSIAVFILYNKMLSGGEKVKTVLDMKFQDKTKSKRCDCAMQRNHSRKGHLFWNMFNVIWTFSKRHASEACTLS